MPGRHVRFASSNVYHSPPAQVPSLTYSPSSLSSPGPFTPPSIPVVLPGPSPYAFSLPPSRHPQPKIPGPIHMHSLLGLSYPPPINYDLTLPPSTVSTHHHSLSKRSLSEPATNPPLPSLTVVTPHLPRGRTILVTASRNGAFVTVSDVLDAIYHALRANVSSADYYSLPSQKDMQRVTLAYEARCKRIRDSRAYAEEKRQGAKRVDFLMGLTKFMGLSRTSSGPDVWLLNIS